MELYYRFEYRTPIFAEIHRNTFQCFQKPAFFLDWSFASARQRPLEEKGGFQGISVPSETPNDLHAERKPGRIG